MTSVQLKKRKPPFQPVGFLLRAPHRPPTADKDEIREATQAINEASKHVAGFLTAFLGLSASIAVSFASTTDKMILYNSNILLPVIGFGVPLLIFYSLMPLIYLLLHFNLILHIAMLRDQVLVFEHSCANHPERENKTKLLFPFFVTRAFINSDRSWPQQFLFTLTVFLLPVALLLWGQDRILASHVVALSWWHRIIIVSDLWILITIGQNASGKRRARSYLFGTAVASFCILGIAFPTEHQCLLPPFLSNIVHQNLTLHNEIIGKDLPTGTDLQLLSTGDATRLKSQPYLDLTGRDLSYADFRGCTLIKVNAGPLLVDDGIPIQSSSTAPTNFAGASFVRSKFLACNFEQSYFVGANLDQTTFVGSDLSQANFSDAILSRADLEHAKLTGSNLTRAYLNFSKFQGAHLESATLSSAKTFLTNFHGANLACADLNNGQFENSNFSNTNLSLSKLYGAVMSGSNMTHADIDGTNASHTILKFVNLSEADLHSTNFQFADLSSANLLNTNLSSADMRNAVLSNAKLPGDYSVLTRRWGTPFSKPDARR